MSKGERHIRTISDTCLVWRNIPFDALFGIRKIIISIRTFLRPHYVSDNGQIQYCRSAQIKVVTPILFRPILLHSSMHVIQRILYIRKALVFNPDSPGKVAQWIGRSIREC
jgi:hypothetical protein